MSLLQELEYDFNICRKEFKQTYPTLDWDYAMEKFNESEYANEDWSWPVYHKEGHDAFIRFVNKELLKEK